MAADGIDVLLVQEYLTARFDLLVHALEVPIVGYFAIRYLPEAPGPALRVLAVQAAAQGMIERIHMITRKPYHTLYVVLGRVQRILEDDHVTTLWSVKQVADFVQHNPLMVM